MTTETHRQIARTAMWASVVFNLGMIGVDLTRREFGYATFTSVVAVLLLSWIWLVEKIEAKLDAQLGQAVATRRMAELTLAQMQDAVQSGHFRIDVDVEPRPRAH